MKILVIEDNTQSLYLLQQYFAGRGHVVWPAANGREALAMINANGAPDAVVSDALMPLMDGFEFCTAIRRDPRYHTLPFILYTATYTADSDERFALSIGVDRFVVKPIEPERLMIIVDEVVAAVKSRPPREIVRTQLAEEQLQEYTRMVLVKLEDKLAELSAANAALLASEESVRTLNEKLVATVHHLEAEIDEHRRSEELLRMAQNAGGIGCWESATRGDIHWTEEACALLGYAVRPEPRLITDFLKDIVAEDRKRAEETFATLSANTSKTFELEIRLGTNSGKPKHLLLRGAHFPAKNGGTARWLGIVQDITARKEAEQRRQALEQQLFRSQKMEALGNLAGGIAHDFNNILTAILGHNDLLRSSLTHMPPADPCHTSLAEISNAGQRARDIIKQILTFSRRQPIERRPQVFSKTVEEALQLARATVGRINRIQASYATDRMVSVNEAQIQQVLLNLCTNAAQAMNPKGGTITISVTPFDMEAPQGGSRPSLRAGPYVRLTVSDNGPGMEPSILEHIFEPFFTTKKPGEGTGLGLSVVHGIVQAHDGAIGVESAPGKGCTFSLFFPACSGPVESTASAATEAINTTGGGKAVLVVDDEPSVARICAQLLQQIGFVPTTVNDPVEAREIFERNPENFAAAVVDFLMPKMTGLDFARALWLKRPDLPIVLMAGFGAQVDATRARAEGFSEFLTKPFTVATLTAALGRALKSVPPKPSLT
jgi:PAS domain S-box-containing protein